MTFLLSQHMPAPAACIYRTRQATSIALQLHFCSRSLIENIATYSIPLDFNR